MASGVGFAPLTDFVCYTPAEMLRRAEAFHELMRRRRTVRDFSPEPVDRAVIEHCILAAGAAPSGANRQPWHFAVVGDASVKRRIREAAEAEEHAFYANRAPPEWLDALAPLGTGPDKPFLETAPWLIAIFAESYALDAAGAKAKNYYVTESVGIATGFLIAALHACGLAALTHTPSPMGFLNAILGRPPNERPFLLLVVGRPAPDARVPRIVRKPLEAIASFA
jgi:iodotyrosine deiodinase